MKDSTEARLIARCRAGDTDAWEALFDQQYAPVYRFIFQLGYGLSHEDAEEICQETLLAVVRKLGDFQGGSALQTWMFRIAANKANDFLQRRRAAKRGSGRAPLSLEAEDPDTGRRLDPPDPLHPPDSALLEEERLAWVHGAVSRLDPPCREIVQLRYFGELSYEELSAALELHPKTVSSRLSRCLDRLERIVRESVSREKVELFPV